MAALVENMMYTRTVPWHGLGTRVDEAPTSADALRLAGLDWTVEQKNIQLCGGAKIQNYKANVRSSDGQVLGIVSDRYKIVQNKDAFEFTDSIIGGDVRYETAGSLNGGRKVWLLAKLPETEIAGDKTEPYMVFSNTHDGSGAIRVAMTPIRVVCNNTLNLALDSAKRAWSVRHTGDLNSKMHEARVCLKMANAYMGALAERADRLANTTVTRDQLNMILDKLFPMDETGTEREKQGVKKLRDEFMVCYFAPDILKFRNTAFGVVNAVSDMVTHNLPRRKTENYRENNWGRIMDGHILLDKVCAKVNTL